MKKWTSLLFVVAVMLFMACGTASAETVAPKLVLNGKILNPVEPPTLIGSFTMVPIRIVGENLGYKVDYDSSKKQVTVTSGSSKVEMVLDKKSASVDGKLVALQAAPTARSNTTLIPLRFVGEALGLQVYWDNTNKSVFLYSNNSNGSDTGNESGSGSNGSGGDSGSGDSGNPSDGGGADPSLPEGGGTENGGEVTNPSTSVTSVHSVSYENDSIVIKYSDGFLIPKASVLTGPDRIVIDLPSADFATDFQPALATDGNSVVKPLGELAVADHVALTKVRYSLFSDNPKTLRFVLDLNQKWSYEIVNDASLRTLTIKLVDPSTVPADEPPSGTYTIVLDAGHGGSDPGALSITGKREKDFNLAVILKLQAILAADSRFNLVLTRSGDTYPSLADRYNLANSIKADLFLSVHGNSNTKNTVTGTEVYYTRDASLAFAKAVHTYATPTTGLKDRGVIQKSLAVTRETTMPAVLFEAGYLSNSGDESVMYLETFQSNVAQGLATAIKKYLKLE
ncbi:N-acetylmuramoyl-L-alanine amidase family protein [Cohnella thailandensis]|uniref:N-acetylmuramoyl-L-alanine amidase n=1 Tax=Cohnella thailandensis TaxID=557557 RepID=A0A841T3X9_9BACL|nr:N-acetylmuramoyl-L-alanine amidase family protein [Cohnella thailandensis]MBB6636770.1 N-acetylmuramoyl-L-alanine amidase [Cohnella thailandensis]MBP1973353.1 N-acetylmuramoyl-L-alanine amidase [Cohnella thailandensis]